MTAEDIIANSEKIITPQGEEAIIIEKKKISPNITITIICETSKFSSLLDQAQADTENKMGWAKYIEYWKSKGWL